MAKYKVKDGQKPTKKSKQKAGYDEWKLTLTKDTALSLVINKLEKDANKITLLVTGIVDGVVLVDYQAVDSMPLNQDVYDVWELEISKENSRELAVMIVEHFNARPRSDEITIFINATF